MLFIVENDKVFKEEITFFKKKKLKETTFDELFQYSAENIKKNNTYPIMPNVKGLNVVSYLFNKAEWASGKRFSDFNQKTIWKFKKTSEKIITIPNDKEVEISVLTGQLEAFNENGTKFYESVIDFPSMYKTSEKMVELLIQNASNGIYATARDIENCIMAIKELNPSETFSYYCDECGEKFETLDDFFCHLIENAHYDSILDEYIYDKEVSRVKKLVEEKRK